MAGVMDRPAPGSCGVRGVVQHQLIIALRQQTARVLVVHHELRGHGAARLLLPALRRLAATLIPVNHLVNGSLAVCRPGSVHKKFKKTYPKETSFFYNNQP